MEDAIRIVWEIFGIKKLSSRGPGECDQEFCGEETRYFHKFAKQVLESPEFILPWQWCFRLCGALLRRML